jgi:dipeptidyl aminopeptidase/acylaminoacyl peptidase
MEKLKKEVLEKTNGMNIDEVNPVEAAKNCKVPAFFIHGEKDTLIPFSHVGEIMENY